MDGGILKSSYRMLCLIICVLIVLLISEDCSPWQISTFVIS